MKRGKIDSDTLSTWPAASLATYRTDWPYKIKSGKDIEESAERFK